MRPLTIADVRLDGTRVIAVPAWALGDDRMPIAGAWDELRAKFNGYLYPAYNTWGGPKSCAACGAPFYGNTVVKCCTDRCARERRAATRTRGQVPKVEHRPRACKGCSRPFTPARSDARYCSGRCRVAAHRVHARGSGI